MNRDSTVMARAIRAAPSRRSLTSASTAPAARAAAPTSPGRRDPSSASPARSRLLPPLDLLEPAVVKLGGQPDVGVPGVDAAVHHPALVGEPLLDLLVGGALEQDVLGQDGVDRPSPLVPPQRHDTTHSRLTALCPGSNSSSHTLTS